MEALVHRHALGREVLPQRLPGRAVAALSESNAKAVREDYRFVITQLGPCGRTIAR